MLPPQLRHRATRPLTPSNLRALTAASVLALRPITARVNSRSFWGRRSYDWASPTDPVYQRFHRIRTLKTRAKLLEKIRRRGKFEWDIDQRPFFTPKQIRWASHWHDGSGRRRWWLNDEPSPKKDETHTEGQEEGYELSEREKQWKEHVAKMRKRIESDPYEAVFGKRFEPFWTPLVPSWMREEMGLQGWAKRKDAAHPTAISPTPPKAMPSNPIASESKETPAPEETASNRQTVETSPLAASETPQAQKADPSSYSYASSTSWNSLTNKTTKVEWDSFSKKTKRYEYDPISNRMVMVQPPKISENSTPEADSDAPLNDKPAPTPPGSASDSPAELRKPIPIPQPPPQSYLNVPIEIEPSTSLSPAKSRAVSALETKPPALVKMPQQDLDLLTANDVRASMGKIKPSTDRPKSTTPLEKAEMERDFDQKSQERDYQVDAILKERDTAQSTMHRNSELDQAEMGYLLDQELESLRKKREKLIKDERGLFHVEKLSRELQKLDTRIEEVSAQRSRAAMSNTIFPPGDKAQLLSSHQSSGSSTGTVSHPVASPLQPSIDRLQSKELPKTIDPDDSAAHESTEPITSPNVPRDWSSQTDMLQADRVHRTAIKRPPPVPRWIDDMKARKAQYEAEKAKIDATADVAHAERNASLVKANQMLQAEVAEQKLRMQIHETRYAHKIRDHKGELQNAYKQSSVHSMDHLDRIKSLEQELSKTQKLAEESGAAVEKQGKAYKNKIRSLRDELEIAYKQSTVHSEKHLERIQNLENELARSQRVATDTEAAIERSNKGYKDKLRSLRNELDIAFKQSTAHSEKHLEHIRWLEQELSKAKSSRQQTSQQIVSGSPGALLAEGDFCPNVTKFADSEKWYKRPAHVVPQPSERETAKAEQRLRDQLLTREVREIYENHYGKIDINHRQEAQLAPRKISASNIRNSKKLKQVVEVESDVDLGEELAKFEKEKEQLPYRFPYDFLEMVGKETQHEPNRLRPVELKKLEKEREQLPYRFRHDNLENEIVRDEGKANDEQAVMQPETSEKMRQRIAEQLRLEDHGLISPKGKNTGVKNPLAGRKTSSAEVTAVNPVDGTRASPATGNFASPTGFVNHDPVFPSDKKVSTDRIVPTDKDRSSQAIADFKVNAALLPSQQRVRRQERHFTGLPPSQTRASVEEKAAAVEGSLEWYINEAGKEGGLSGHETNEAADAAALNRKIRKQLRRLKLQTLQTSENEHRLWREEQQWRRRRRAVIFPWAVKAAWASVAALAFVYLVGAVAEKSRNEDLNRLAMERRASRARGEEY